MPHSNTSFRRLCLKISVLSILGTATANAATLEVSAWKGNDAEPAAMPELIERFEAAHPDITIDFTYISRTDTDIVLPPRLQSGDAPDVMMADMPLVKVWSDAGLLAPLDKSGWYDRLTPSVRDAISTTGDDVYVMPLEVIGMGNYVNMTLLNAAGINTPPTTIDALIDACTALQANGTNPMLLTGGFPSTLFVVSNGLEADPSAAAALGSGDSTFKENAAFKDALLQVRKLADANCFNAKEVAGVDPWSTALAEFKAGNFAMIPQGAWNVQNFGTVDDLDFVFAPIPTSKGDGVALDLFGFGWSISADSEQMDAARKFVDFFTVDENLKPLLVAESAYSPFTDGSSGMAALAAPYDAARAAGASILFPYSILQWPKELEGEMFDSMTGFLLDIDQEPENILTRWDEIIEDQ